MQRRARFPHFLMAFGRLFLRSSSRTCRSCAAHAPLDTLPNAVFTGDVWISASSRPTRRRPVVGRRRCALAQLGGCTRRDVRVARETAPCRRSMATARADAGPARGPPRARRRRCGCESWRRGARARRPPPSRCRIRLSAHRRWRRGAAAAASTPPSPPPRGCETANGTVAIDAGSEALGTSAPAAPSAVGGGDGGGGAAARVPARRHVEGHPGRGEGHHRGRRRATVYHVTGHAAPNQGTPP